MTQSNVHELFNYGTAFFWFLAYSSILLKLNRQQSASGLSMQSLLACAFSEFNNLLIQIYLSIKHRQFVSWAFFVCDVSTTALSIYCFCLILMRTKYWRTYQKDKDIFGDSFSRLFKREGSLIARWLFLYVVAAAIAIPVYFVRRTSYPMIFSYYECFDDLVLALALVPQLVMFYTDSPPRVSALLANFVMFLTVARICAFSYWATFALFYPNRRSYPSRGLHMFTEALNILILADFIYYYIKARLNGEKDVLLPS
eukprot:Filipodium_phascolosomae@DN4997_c0_g1_i1.p1